ncbi:MAG: BREX-3 system phosphatase PglZ, partial [Spirochaetia bacterium]
MSSWRDQILKEFTPKVVRLTLVADPDGLLLEEGILEGIRERGFELIPFEDHIAFRYAYESKFRSRWDRGEHTDLVVVLRSQASDLSGLPYDLLQAGRRLSFNLGDIFPNLSYPVLTALDRGDLDALYEAQKGHAPGQLGDNATKEFVLRHVFEIAPELIKQPSDLLRVLLRRHYQGQRVPVILDERFIQLLRQNSTFEDWPLETLVPDREAFFAFLQERWPIFLDREAAKGSSEAQENKEPHGLAISVPADLPFEHHDIRVYIDNLFVEGLLHSVSHEHAYTLSKTWVGIGVRTAPIEDGTRRLSKLIDSLQTSIPVDDARHTDWFHFARAWAELVLLMNEQPDVIPEETNEHAKSLQAQVDAGFAAWLFKRYAGLVNLPPV